MPLARTLIVALAFALAGPIVACAETDRSDPLEVSAAFLTAFQERDLDRLATLVSEHNRQTFEDIAAQGETHPDYSEVFTGWRAEAADAWDGETLDLRFAGEDAVVRFADLPTGESAVLVLVNQDGWGLDDINSPDRASFEALPATP